MQLLRTLTLRIGLLSVLYSLSFFVRTLTYRRLYTLTTGLGSAHLTDFYADVMKFVLVILVVESVHRLLYYQSKKQLNRTVTSLLTSAVNGLTYSPVKHFAGYPKEHVEALYALHDLVYIFESVYEKVTLSLPRNGIYLVYYLTELYRFSVGTVVTMVVISMVATLLLHHVTRLKEWNYNSLYRTDIRIKKKHTERLNNLKYIQASVSERLETDLVTDSYQLRLRLKDRDMMLTGILTGIPDLTGTLMTCVIYLLGASYVKADLLKPLELIFLGSNSMNFISSLLDTKGVWDDYNKHATQMGVVYDIISRPTHHHDPPAPATPLGPLTQITLRPNSPGETVTLKAGRITALTGKNGSGKTTLVLAMLGLNDVTDWHFEFDGATSDPDTIRRRVGMVFQEPFMFDETVWYNVTYNLDTPESRVLSTAEMIGMRDWLVENRNRTIGVAGEFLSGGERKKLQLLNMLLQDKQVYIFDEPTNNLDGDVRTWYADRVVQLAHDGKIVLIITHDDALVQRAHSVVRLPERGHAP